jgi:hypothetical protein
MTHVNYISIYINKPFVFVACEMNYSSVCGQNLTIWDIPIALKINLRDL